MNVLSVFDGMSCGRIALERIGVPVTKYFASEIDKYAIKVSQANYPDIIHIGTVTDVIAGSLPVIDLLIGGSPCQGFSYAGRQLNFNDPRSVLFFEFVRLLEEIKVLNPSILFLLENVKMKQEFQDIISEALGVKPVLINSALVSAQTRKRLYWTNIPFASSQPLDKGILLKHILEGSFHEDNREKSTCITSTYNRKNLSDIQRPNPRCTTVKLSDGELEYMNRTTKDGRTHWDYGYIHDTNKDKSQCLTANISKDVPYNVIIDRRHDCIEVGNIYPNKGMNGRIYSAEGKSPTLRTPTGGNSMPKIGSTDIYRKLTPIECERLQGVPDNYTAHVSATQRYKMLGNGWNIDTITHLFSPLNCLDLL